MQSLKRFNFMIREDIRKEFEELVPPGERSRVMNEALKKELLHLKREKLTEKLLSLRNESPSLTTSDIVKAINKDRTRGLN